MCKKYITKINNCRKIKAELKNRERKQKEFINLINKKNSRARKMELEKQIHSYETIISIIEEQLKELEKTSLQDIALNKQILYRENLLKCFKELQFEAMVKLYSTEGFEYENLSSSVLLLFRDKTYNDTIKLLKRIVRDLKKGMKNNKI